LVFKDSGDWNTRHFNTGTIGFPDVFSSGYQIGYDHPILGPVFKFCASLDCFIHKENIFFIKQSSLQTIGKLGKNFLLAYTILYITGNISFAKKWSSLADL
jgi:hypothetical protein